MIAIGNDHAGLPLKQAVLEVLQEMGIKYRDVGTNSADSCDYPVSGEQAARLVADGTCTLGVVICGTGIGIGLAANKVRGIRCAMVSDVYSAVMARQHNDANMLALGARVVGPGAAQMIVRSFLTAKFEGGRHQRRVDLLKDIERRQATT